MDKKSIMKQICGCVTPWDDGGYYDYMHPDYKILSIADWIIKVKKPLNDDDFWLAVIGCLTDDEKEKAISLVKFLKGYKIRGTSGKEKNALGVRELLGIKMADKNYVECFWQFGNGTNGLDNDIMPAMKESERLIDEIRQKEFVKDAYLLSSCSNPLNDTYTWYIKILL